MKPSRLKLAYAGTPAFAGSLLESLLEANRHDVALVLTRPDRRSGRGRKTIDNPVRQCAEKFGIPVLQPENAAAIDPCCLDNCDLLIVVAYGMLLPEPILAAPRSGCINVHLSLLPRWRGASPAQHAILAGDRQSGVSIMQMDQGLDTGPIYLARPCAIDERETAGSLYCKLGQIARAALAEFLERFIEGDAHAQPQDSALATYASKISRQDTAIDWRCSAGEIDRKIRAFNPVPVAHADIEGMNLKIWEAEAVDEPGSAAPGQIIRPCKNRLTVQTGDGLLNITRLQPPGKNIMTAADFLNGRPEFANGRTSFEACL